jgi:hypothetical protein
MANKALATRQKMMIRQPLAQPAKPLRPPAPQQRAAMPYPAPVELPGKTVAGKAPRKR